MFNLGLPEMLLIGFLAVLFFGAKSLPNLAKGLGESVRELRNSLKVDEVETAMKDIKSELVQTKAEIKGTSSN